MAHHQRGYDPMELREFNQSYYANQMESSPLEMHAIDMQLPGTPDRRRRIPPDQRSDASSYHSDGESPRATHSSPEAVRQQADLLEALPSRQLESAIQSSSTIRRPNGTVRKRRKAKVPASHATLRFRQGGESAQALLDAWAHEDADVVDGEEPEDDLERQKQLKTMTMLRLHQKKEVRKALLKSSSKRKVRKITCWKQFKYSSSVRWTHFKESLRNFAYFFRFWTGHLKTIEGLFGTGVTSYFKFLKWLFLLNIPTFLVVVGFLVVPQLLYRFEVVNQGSYNDSVPFTGIELLTGGGWFNQTEMYYGYYTNQIIQILNSKYDMRFAYICTTGGYFLFCLIILGHSLSKSYRTNYIEGSSEFNLIYVEKVFAGWDFAITSPSTAKLKHKSIFKELQEFLAGYSHARKQRAWSDICGWYVFRLGTNFFVLALIIGTGYLIYYIANTNLVMNEVLVLKDMAMPLCMTGVNYVLPFIFYVIGRFENYEQPKSELYITMVRTMVLRLATLAVIISFWFRKAQCLDKVNCLPCWETFVGEELYKLVIVDFAFIILASLFTELLMRAFSQCIKRLPHPEFNIGRNTLDLIYTQTLCWTGTYFSPFLVFINIVKLFLIFYLKRVSVTVSCVPSSKPWRAARTHTIFLFFTLLSLILSVVAIACSIIFIPPSKACGPFRNESTAYSIVLNEIQKWRGMKEVVWLTTIIDIVSSVGFIVALLVFLCVVLFYMRILCSGRNKMVQLLKHQIQMEGKDKVFLLKMWQDVSCAAPNVLKTIYSEDVLNKTQSARTPDTKTFAKLEQQMGVEHHLMSPEKIKKNLAGTDSTKSSQHQNVSNARSPGDAREKGTPLAQRRLLLKENRYQGTANGQNMNQNNQYASQPELRVRSNMGHVNPGYNSGPGQNSPLDYRGSDAPIWHSHDNLPSYTEPHGRRY